jgi:hypothetical protein
MEDQLTPDAKAEVQARMESGIRPCGKCRRQLEKKVGCCYVKCDECKRGECWICGNEIPHTSEACNNHGCKPEALLAKEAAVLSAKQQAVTKPNSLLVTLLTGETVTVTYSPDWTVLQLKQELQRKTQLSPSQMSTLTHTGTPLDDRKKLTDYKLRSKSTLVLTVPVVGG